MHNQNEKSDVYHLLKNHIKSKSNQPSENSNLEHLLSQSKLDSSGKYHLIVAGQKILDHHVVKLDSKNGLHKKDDTEDFNGYHVLVVKKLNQATENSQLNENHTVKKIDNNQNDYFNDQQLVRKHDALIHHVIKKKINEI